MKHIITWIVAAAVFVQWSLAGGSTSIVTIDRVDDITIEEQKITVKGSGSAIIRVMSSEDQGGSMVYGQPAQIVKARVVDGTFEIVPYFTCTDIEGVPTGGHSQEELEKLSAEWWEQVTETAIKVRKGDRVIIGYQADSITISGYKVKRIVGSGTLRIESKPPLKD